MLATFFVASGLDALRHPAARAQAAAPLVKALAGPLKIPDDPEMLVRANGATMMAAGTMLGLGKFPRLAALALTGALVPSTYVRHPFWAIEDPAEKAQQRVHFLKNISLIGAVLLASVDTAGKPGLAYRSRQVRADAHRQAALTRREARHAASSARRFAKNALD